MRTIIAGSRSATFGDVLNAMRACPFTTNISVVISGKAKGGDEGGEKWALRSNIPIEEYPADWDRYGKRAGYVRNTEMAKRGQALIAVWDGVSKGTKNMIDLAQEFGLKIYVHRFGDML